MSLLGKRDFDFFSDFDSQATWADIPPQDMSQRSYGSQFSALSVPRNRRMAVSYNRRRRYSKRKVPRAIRTRGTPDGYYEIPVKVLTRLYVNTSSGIWDTNQTTGASVGVTGYQGISFWSSLDAMTTSLGNGSISAQVIQTPPGFAELQAVFDEGKICKVMYDCWVTAQVPNADSTAGNYGAPDLFLCYDPNNADPPSSLDQVLQYSDVKRICFDSNQRTRITYVPKIRTDGGSAQVETGSATTLSISQGATYMQMTKPAVAHFGLRGWLAIPTAANSRVYQINILKTEIRRYKVNK